MSALVASKPPKASGPSSSRAKRWELPPVAVLGMFAAVAVLGFALAAPFSNHLNTAAASGGGGQNGVEPGEAPSADDSATAPAPESPTVAAVPVAPLPTPVPAKTAVPTPGARANDAHAHATPPSTAIVAAREDVAPTPSSSVATTAAIPARRPGRKTATAAGPVADEFGGRE
jgi:cytoskeletal protein RodZ